MTNFRVGQKVVCVAEFSGRCPHPIEPKVGDILTVRETFINPPTGELGLRFTEIVNEIHHFYGVERGYKATRFRPVVERRTDISVFRAMLTPSKQKVEA